MMHQVQLHGAVVSDRDLGEILNHFTRYLTVTTMPHGSTRTHIGINLMTPSQATHDRQSRISPGSINAAHNRSMVNFVAQVISSLLKLPLTCRSKAPVKKESILWTKNKKMSIDIFLYSTYFK
jgi:hypothetical protein